MKLAIFSMLLAVLATSMEQASAAPFFFDRIPSIGDIPARIGRMFENGRNDFDRSVRRNNEAIARMVDTTSNRISSGSRNFMSTIDGVIPDIIPGFPVFG